MVVEFNIELPDELVDRGRVLAAKRGKTLEEMIVQHIESVVAMARTDKAGSQS